MHQTFSIVKRNWGCYAFFVLAGGLSLLRAPSGFFLIITILLAAVVSLFVQNAVLMNLSFKESLKRNTNIGWMFIPYFLKAVIIVSISILTTISIIEVSDRFTTWKRFTAHSVKWITTKNVFGTIYDDFPLGEVIEIVSIILGYSPQFLIAIFLSAALISIIGTWLPATLYGQKTSLADAFQRGKSTFFKTVWRLFLDLVVWCLMVGITPVISAFFLLGAFGSLNLSDFLVLSLSTIAIIFIQTVCLTYISVVLTNIYKKSEGLELSDKNDLQLLTSI